MKVKIVPPAPPSTETVFEVQCAVPLVPEPEESCCARLLARTEIPAQDEAKEWLTFMTGLGLVREGERGFYRVRTASEDFDIAGAFREGVYGVEDLLGTLGPEPTTTEAVFERFESEVPSWERHHNADWRSVWRDRVDRLLAWSVLLGLVDEEATGYVRRE